MVTDGKIDLYTPADFGDTPESFSAEIASRAKLELTNSICLHLPQIATLIAVMYLILGLIDFFTMPASIKVQTMLIAFLTTSVFATFATVSRRTPPAPEHVHLILFTFIVILQVDGMAFTILSNDIMMSLGVSILIIAIGSFYASIPWMLLTFAFLILSTLVVVEFGNIEYSIIQYSLILIASLFFASVVFHFRRATAIQLERFRDSEQEYVQKLEHAYTRIDTLDGLLPICASCKKIRDDQGYWSSVERYITERTKAVFTHGMCPNCICEFDPESEQETGSQS